MIYNSYDEYMKEVLGHSELSNNIYNTRGMYPIDYNKQFKYENMCNNNAFCVNEQMYPEIYKIIKPLVYDVCQKNNKPITEETIKEMVEHVYSNVIKNVVVQNVLNLNIEVNRNIDDENKVKQEAEQSKCNYSRINNNIKTEIKNKETYSCCDNDSVFNSRKLKNKLLEDLIHILVLNELSNNRNYYNHCPMPYMMPMNYMYGPKMY
ncbi:MAG: hypothetical protein E7313_04790 [Clostridiales bacterium]|nr:hypothetical protein [Clostridiales bacterium]